MKHYKSTQPMSSLGLASLAISSFLAGTHAQDTADGNVVELSPFVIETDSIRGYATTSSLGASRVAVPITELDTSVFTINENLIRDTVATELRDTLNFVSNANNIGQGGDSGPQFSLRGYTTSSMQRDGLPTAGVGNQGGFDYAYVQRLEVIKGSAGVLYGTHSPGGIVNIISKMPLPEPKTVLGAQFGSWNAYRFTADHSNLIGEGKKLGYRVAFAYADTDGPMGYPNEPTGGLTVFNPSVSYKMDNGAKVWVWGKFIRDYSMRQQRTVYSFNDSQQIGTQLDRMARDGKYSIQFDRRDQAFESDEWEIGATQSFNLGFIDLNARVVARMNDRFNDASRVRGIGTREFHGIDGVIGTDARNIDIADVDDELVAVYRTAIRYDERPQESDGWSVTADLNWKFETGPVKHNLLTYITTSGGSSLSKDNLIDINPLSALPAQALNELGLRVNPDTGRGLIQVWPNPNGFNITKEFVQRFPTRTIVRNPSDRESEATAYAIMERASFLNDRLFLVAGVRKDTLDSTTIVTNDVGSVTNTENVDNTSIKYSALAKIYENDGNVASLYFSNSETFIPEFGIDERLSNFGATLPNRTATLEEFGIKFDVMDSRIVGTVSVFETVEDNFLITLQDDDGSVTGLPDNAYRVPANDRSTSGWEVDLALNVVDGLDILLSYGDIESILDNGNPANAMPDYTYSAAVKYAFNDGPLKGLSALWMYNGWGSSFQRGGGLGGGSSTFTVRSSEIQNLVLGYRLDNWNFQLRINNLMDDIVYRPSTFWTAVGVEPERNFRFSITRTF